MAQSNERALTRPGGGVCKGHQSRLRNVLFDIRMSVCPCLGEAPCVKSAPLVAL
jgi:hypothetical protein